MGTAVWFNVLSKSSLNELFTIKWFNVNIHRNFSTLGRKSILKIFPNLKIYHQFRKLIIDFGPDLVLIPVSQSTIGFYKGFHPYKNLSEEKPRFLLCFTEMQPS